jgi:hypothetical protein
MEQKNRNWLYKKGKVFIHKRWGTLVKITSYTPPIKNEYEKVTFEEINLPEPRSGECFGDIPKYLYDIDHEIEVFNENFYKNSKNDLTEE